MGLRTPDAPSTSEPDIEAGVIKDARQRQRRQRVAWLLPIAAAILAGLIFASTGEGGGSNPAGNTHGNADLIRRAEQAIEVKPGTIVVQVVRGFSSPPLPSSNPVIVTEQVLETPAGSDPQNYLNSDAPPLAGRPSADGVVNGVQEYYLRTSNTIYLSSIWGPYITEGKTPGTFIYTHPTYPDATSTYAQTVIAGRLPPKPLTLTAAQAHALLDGSDTITDPDGPTGAWRITPVRRIPSPVDGLWSLLRSHDLRVAGLTTIDGRRAVEFDGPTFKYNSRHIETGDGAGVKFWVDAGTYTPIKEVIDQPRVDRDTETWLEYKTLPITPSSQRLLNPSALHPHARTDRNYNNYVNATYQWFAPGGTVF